jgi:hypothetical protein
VRRALVLAAAALFVAGCLPFETNFVSPTPTPSPEPSVVAADLACATSMKPYAEAVSSIWGMAADGVTYQGYVEALGAVHKAQADARAVSGATDHCRSYRSDLDEATRDFDEALTEWNACRASGACVEGQPIPSSQACAQQLSTCGPVTDFGTTLGWLWDKAEIPIDTARQRFPFPPPGLQ